MLAYTNFFSWLVLVETYFISILLLLRKLNTSLHWRLHILTSFLTGACINSLPFLNGACIWLLPLFLDGRLHILTSFLDWRLCKLTSFLTGACIYLLPFLTGACVNTWMHNAHLYSFILRRTWSGLSVGRSVGCLVGRSVCGSVCHNYLKGRKLHFISYIGALVRNMYQDSNLKAETGSWRIPSYAPLFTPHSSHSILSLTDFMLIKS